MVRESKLARALTDGSAYLQMLSTGRHDPIHANDGDMFDNAVPAVHLLKCGGMYRNKGNTHFPFSDMNNQLRGNSSAGCGALEKWLQ